jgi:hypothetical protein
VAYKKLFLATQKPKQKAPVLLEDEGLSAVSWCHHHLPAGANQSANLSGLIQLTPHWANQTNPAR